MHLYIVNSKIYLYDYADFLMENYVFITVQYSLQLLMYKIGGRFISAQGEWI